MEKTFSFAVPKYSKYQPKINLEILTAKSANRMLIVTYVAFIVCLVVYLIYLNSQFRKYSQITNPSRCSKCGSSYSYYNFYKNQDSTFAFKLDVTQSNFTTLIGWDEGSQPGVCTPVSLVYDLFLWACYDSQGNCVFPMKADRNNPDYWHYVYTERKININTNMCSLKASDSFTTSLIPPSYQNDVCTYSLIYSLNKFILF